jgi:transcriptional regulator with XRE-family HTH domain
MNNLKKLRLEHDMSVRDLADKTGICYSSISLMENGKQKIKDNYIKIFTELFNCSADYLLGIDAPVPEEHKYKKFFELHDCVDSLSDDQAKAILSLIKTYNQEEK